MKKRRDVITEPLQVVTAADVNYLSYLAPLLASLGKHGSAHHPLQITVIHRGISKPLQKALAQLIPPMHHLSWFEPHISHLRKMKAPLAFATCKPHYLRLLIHFLLPTCSRAIYLDADTLVLGDLSSLWTTQLEGYTIAATHDYIPQISEGIGNWKELHLDPTAPYFNSGVLLIDLVQWKAEQVCERVLKICGAYPNELVAQGKWPQHDQYGLNVVLYQRWKPLDRTWNYGTDLPPSPARVIHYIGNGKIELPTCHPFFRQLFFQMLGDLPWRI